MMNLNGEGGYGGKSNRFALNGRGVYRLGMRLGEKRERGRVVGGFVRWGER
jgi:hypothetical protein